MKAIIIINKEKISMVFMILFIFSFHSFKAQTFQDDLAGEVQGEFPSQWNLIKGSAEVASQEGSSFIYLSNNAVISPKINGEDYIANNFTLEFDAYFDDVSKGPLNQYYQIRFWNGTSYLVLGNDHVNPLTIMCHGSKLDGRIDGSKVTYDGYMQSLKKPLDVWRHVTVNYNNGTLKVKIDDFQSINIQALPFNPEIISIGVFSGSHTDFVRGIKNIRITGIDGSAEINTGPSNTGMSDNNDNPNDTTITYNYALPIEDGTPNQILETDGNGTVSWVNHEHPHDHLGNNDTGGTNTATGGEGLKINDLLDGKSDPDGSSVFLGLNTGNSDDGSDNKNVGIGFEVLKNNTTGNANTANGYQTLLNNIEGWSNTAIGYQTLLNNTSGISNVGVGYQALLNSTTAEGNVAIGSRALYLNTTGRSNTAIGTSALQDNTTGVDNTASGRFALSNNTEGNENTANGRSALLNNTTGSFNTAIGSMALNKNTTAEGNTAIGSEALYNNSTGYSNTANGQLSLYSNTTGNANTAIGSGALYKNTIGGGNVANGNSTLYRNTTGNFNTAIGLASLHFNTIGDGNTGIGHKTLYNNIGKENTATGNKALYNNTTGNFNTATGSEALYENTTGGYNTAYGNRALYLNTTGIQNTAIGINTLYKNTSGSLNNAFGDAALYNNTTGIKNTAIGNAALSNITTGNNNIGVGNNAQVPVNTASNQIRIGNTDIHYAGVQVPWHVTSDQIWKEDIRLLPYGLDFVKQLKPVDYIRKNNKTNTREIGFIAQDVEQVLLKIGFEDQGILTEDDEGRLSLRYNDLIPLLTKAIQEQQIIIEDLKSRIETLEIKYEK